MPVFTPITDAKLVGMVRTLAASIAGKGVTALVGIGRGGLVPAVYLSHATGLPMLSVDYWSQNADLAAPAIARLAERTRAGERLLFVDDINDSGRTIGRLRALLAEAGAVPGGVKFATLIDNVGSAERVDHAARSIDRATCKDWFVFPWEAMASAEAVAADAAEVPDRIG
jgi:hypoxanthine phosphoribosyltransferase